MAIFTVVEPARFSAWAEERYGFCAASALAPIAEGIENTNYRFSADGGSAGGGDYVFTIFELWDAPAVAYYAALMRHFAAAGLPVVAPLSGGAAGKSAGEPLGEWEGKPCLVVPFVRGASKPHPTDEDCRQMGGVVAALHVAAAGFGGRCPNPRGRAWRARAGGEVRPHLDDSRRRLLDEALRRDAEFGEAPLPAAACHCDLFRNNVLWDGGRVASVIDFYFGGEDALIFDLAVCACDWCFEDGVFSPEKLRALLAGYAHRRRLTELEKRMFPDALGVAAARFWISRHHDLLVPRRAAQLTPHDPERFENILRAVPPLAEFAELLAEVA